MTAIRDEQGPVVDVELSAGSAVLSARITRRSLDLLGIVEQQNVYALIKAVSFDQRSTGYA